MEIFNLWGKEVGGISRTRQRETWDKGGTQESMGVTLAVTHSIGNIEPEEGTLYGQAGNSLEQ